MFNFTLREMHVRIMQFMLLTWPKIKEFEDINAPLQEEKRGERVHLPWGPVHSIQGQYRLCRLGLGYPAARRPGSRLEKGQGGLGPCKDVGVDSGDQE